LPLPLFSTAGTYGSREHVLDVRGALVMYVRSRACCEVRRGAHGAQIGPAAVYMITHSPTLVAGLVCIGVGLLVLEVRAMATI
jgi:hypothetical protein